MASNLRVDSIVPSTSANVSIGTATGGVTIPGDLGIAGALTYEDVTNIDSVGVITARSGINVSSGDINVSSGKIGISSIIPASKFTVKGGSIFVGDNNMHGGSAGVIEYGGNSGHFDLKSYGMGGQTYIRMFTSNSGSNVEKLRINNDGTVYFRGSSSSDNHRLQIRVNDTDTEFRGSSNSTTNKGFAFYSSNTNASEKLRIKSDGKVNITPGGSLSGSHPPGDLNIVGTNFLTMTPNDNANASDNEVLGVVAFLPYAAGSIAAASAKIEAVAESGQSGSSNATSLRFYNKNSSTGPGNSGIERMRITSNANGTGALYINQTSEVSGANSHLVVNNSVAIVSGSTFRSFYMSGNGNAYFWNGSNQPYISSGGSFTNASDVSLKKDITDLTYGIDVLKNLKPRKYKMKADDKEQIGFIAQEVEADVPEVVEASETPNGDQHKGLAYGNLTAVLTKALQEAVTKIETLEAKVAALEGS